MTTLILIGKFQPFHKGHFYRIVESYKDFSRIVIIPIYYKRRGEILSSKHPIPIEIRVKYIDKILSTYLERKSYIIYPINMAERSFIGKFVQLLESIGDKEYIIYTRDITRYLIFSLFRVIAYNNFDVKVYYEKTNIFPLER
ncbi:hypothetical protein BA065_01890 [Nanoarchaeota archaeon NZ13-N]|uniref:Cytidyltransferase-like domain-containing protein n=1 Tax=Candidatus Nanoclepta minutus TaxID=1940235 RepID=A0A397WMD4_9ARCH|nr:MAG: hypothetical protein BA065_01890 [Nanoarchaeota archaeon NZ13-N]RIB35198.1 MAG: hypothetical protein BXU00_02620 [Candidatus Nanoclepta minutus]